MSAQRDASDETPPPTGSLVLRHRDEQFSGGVAVSRGAVSAARITEKAMADVVKLRRIGILGGSSDQATADYYKQLNKEVNDRLGGFNTAEILINSMNFAFAADCARNGKWEEAGAYLSERAVALEKAGADVIICVSNTLHRVSDRVAAALSIPFLHIAVPTTKAMKAAGVKKVILLGTKPTMTSDYLKNIYRSHGVEVVFPTLEEINELDRIIFDELCRGIILPKSKEYYLKVITRMRAETDAQGVVLGCTEIPLLISAADLSHSYPCFDTTALHVKAAVDFALEGVATKPAPAAVSQP